MIAPQVIQIIAKHINSQLFAVYNDANEIKLHSGPLRNINNDKILIGESLDPNSKLILPFYEGKAKKILNLYNANALDLLNPANTSTLAAKLRKRELQTSILKRMKPMLNSRVTVIFKNGLKISRVSGIFTNMGMMDLSLKPGPFFNKEETLSYNAILNIYDEMGLDLIAV